MGSKDILELRLPRWVDVLVTVNETPKHLSQMAKDTDMTYSHLVRLVQALELKGILVSERRGRQRVVATTSKGARVVALAIGLRGVTDDA